MLRVLGFTVFLSACTFGATRSMPPIAESIRYVSIGDSYTIGEGVEESERFPNVLTKRLRAEGFDITLVANLARSGWTTTDVLQSELPLFESSNPTLVTLLIGANDIVQGVSLEAFQRQYQILLDRMIAVLPNKNRLLVLTIPRFTSTPIGIRLAIGREQLPKMIGAFNAIIKEEAGSRGVAVVDIEPLSKKMLTDPRLLAEDGLHPSGKEYELWVDEMYPVVRKMLEDH